MVTLIGHKLGKYTIVDRLAQGGMAEVYTAFQPGVERKVVMKLLHRHLAEQADFVTRFRREARAIGALQHPHIVRILDVDAQDDLHYMVMEYVRAGTLNQYLKAQGTLPVEEVLRIGVQIAGALAYAHGQGVLHRDIKPANIMFVDDAHQHAVLTDFGLARLCDEDAAKLTVTGALVGTPAYMSPEAVRGEGCDERSDLYSLGVVLYELLTGKTPYEANTPYSMMMKLANDPLPAPRTLNPDLPLALEQLLLRALAKDPADRFQSAAELVAALRQLEATPYSQVSEAPAPIVRATPTKPSTPRTQAAPGWLHLSLATGGVAVVTILTTVLLLHM